MCLRFPHRYTNTQTHKHIYILLSTYIVILIFLILSALFSGTEIAYVSASKLWIELKRKKPSVRGHILSYFYDKPGRFLSTMLVGNNIALVVFTWLVSKSILEPYFFETAGIENELLVLFINTIIITLVVLVFGEFLPKTFFRLFANELIYFFAIPLRVLQFILFVPSWVMTKTTNFLLKNVFRTPIEDDDTVITRLDLENFIKTRGESEEDLNTEFFEKALNLENLKVRDCMVPRTEIEHLDESDTVEDLLQRFKSTQLSRLIIIKDDIDEVLGYVHHQQLLHAPKSIKKIIIEIPFIPEAMQVRDLLNRFINDQINIACVVDEYGGTAGIITMEDILEEIFGEIEDEHDQEEYIDNQISDTEYIFSGRLEIDMLNEKYEQLNFPEGEYSTLSGYLVMTTETIPQQGDEIELHGYKFILELVSETKIETVRVIKLPNDDEEMAE